MSVVAFTFDRALSDAASPDAAGPRDGDPDAAADGRAWMDGHMAGLRAGWLAAGDADARSDVAELAIRLDDHVAARADGEARAIRRMTEVVLAILARLAPLQAAHPDREARVSRLLGLAAGRPGLSIHLSRDASERERRDVDAALRLARPETASRIELRDDVAPGALRATWADGAADDAPRRLVARLGGIVARHLAPEDPPA